MITPEQLATSGTEHGEQTAFFCWAQLQANTWRNNNIRAQSELATKLEMMFAIPNGGERHIAVAGKLKAEGVKAGVPDVMLPVPRQSYKSPCICHGLFIEMKRPSKKPVKANSRGGVANDQESYHLFLRSQGYCVAVCYTWQEARDTVLQYLGVA